MNTKIILVAALAILTGLAALCSLAISCVNPNKWEKSHKMIPENKNDILSREDIEGYYVDSEDSSITLWIKNADEGYTYEMNTEKILLSGTVGFPGDEKYISLNGIKWDLWEIDGEPQKDMPENVEAYIDGNTLTIQNYGNADNHYVKFQDIDKKYITLIKAVEIE